MSSFPEFLSPSNMLSFPSQKERKDLRKLRRRLTMHILHTQTMGFNLTPFIMERKLSLESLKNIVNTVSEELKKQGWGVEFLEGRNMLYVFHPDKKPQELELFVNV
jgi:hypothetical protein